MSFPVPDRKRSESGPIPYEVLFSIKAWVANHSSHRCKTTVLRVQILSAALRDAHKLLGGLLEEADQFLGEDFAEYLRIRLLPEGENIRNKVCHGWMESEKLDEELSLVLLDMILKLSVL